MRTAHLTLPLLLVAGTLVGCQGKEPTQKEKALRHWNQTRAGVLLQLARSQYESGALDKCRLTLTEAMTRDPSSVALRLLSAKLALEHGQLELADREVTTARRLDEKNAEADYLAGVVQQRWQRPAAAGELYAAACRKAPAELAYLLAHAEMLVALERPEEALALLQGQLDNHVNSATIRQAAGQILLQQRRHAEAAAMFRQASLLAPDEPAIREQLGLSLFYAGQHREAGEVLARLLRGPANARRADLWLAAGECQLHIGRPREARSSFENAVQADGSNAAVWRCLAKASMQLGDEKRAESSLNRAMALEESSGQTHLLLGCLRLRQQRVPEAMALFTRASALDPWDPVSLCMIGYCLERGGRGEEAMGHYERALRLRPDDELARTLVTKTAD